MERVIELNREETIWSKMSAIYQYYSPSLRGPYVTDEKEEQPMMSLVAELAHKSATNGQDFDEEILNKVARAIASCVDVFECPVRKSDGRQNC